MRRFGYQALGLGVWRGGKWYLRRRFGAAPRVVAAGGLVAGLAGALLLAGRRAADQV